MDEDKQLHESLTVQGAVVMLLVFAAQHSGIKIGSDELMQVISALLIVGGFIATIVGRIRAHKNLMIGKMRV